MNPEEIDAAMEALQMLRAEAMAAQGGKDPAAMESLGLPPSGAVAAGDTRALGLPDNLGVSRAHEDVMHEDEGKPFPR
jgi:hypothetical protein